MIFDDDDAPDASESSESSESSEETPEEAAEETTEEAAEETPEDAAEETAEDAAEETAEDAAEETAEDTVDESADEPAASEDEAGEESAAAEESAEEAPAEESEAEESADESSEESAEESSEESGEGSAEDGSELTLGESAAEEEEPRAPRQPLLIRGKIDRHGVAIGTGRRKSSVARVRIVDGDGAMVINGRTLDNYFQIERDRLLIEAPLKATETFGTVDVWVRVNGGGLTGQAGAIVLGIARALQAKNPDLHEALSDGGYLTRDGRMVERKKYGYKKARKSFQFSKR